MLSLIILSSTHREKQLKQTIKCLSCLKNYKDFQKIIVFDGNIKKIKNEPLLADCKILKSERIDGFYCWANSINCGIQNSKFDTILYLDGDRIINEKYLNEISKIKEKEFMFPKNLYAFKKELSTNTIKEISLTQKIDEKIMWKDYRETKNPNNSFCKKNPMSGCVAFKKNTYLKTGGFDSMFIGYGYPDIDYFKKTYNLGCQFTEIDCIEYHLYHNYYPLKLRDVLIHGFWNGIKYCEKWNIEIPEEIINSGAKLGLNISNTKKYYFLKDFVKDYENKTYKLF